MNNGIVLHKLKMVYWYIPKVACTTLKIHFADLCGLPYDKSDPMSVHDYCWNQWEKVSEPIKGYFNFAYVRDPVSRIISLYQDKIIFNFSEIVFGRFKDFYLGMPFDEFLMAIDKYRNGDIHFTEQAKLIPHKVHKIKMENDLLLKLLPPYNCNVYYPPYEPTKSQIEMIESIYRKDFGLI